MREIKFRAWSKSKEEMISWPDMVWAQLGDLQSQNLHVMQYTGTEDVEGVPIYEGDIVEYKDYSSGAYIFGEQPLARSAVKWDKQKGGYKVKGGGMWFEGKKFRVIGNIYEGESK